MMKKGYKEYHVSTIFLLVIFATLLFSCEKKNDKITEEENNGLANDELTLLYNTKISEILGQENTMPVMGLDKGQLPESETPLTKQNMIPYVMTVDGNIQLADSFSKGAIFALALALEDEAEYSFRRNVVYIKPESIDKLESKYREYIFNFLRSTFTEDRIRNLEVKLKLDDTNLENIDGEIYIKPNACGIIVSVNIDGRWEFKYDEKHKFIISPDGSREREYIPIYNLKATQTLIRRIIGYNRNRMDSITIRNIPFDRTKQFAAEDAAYFKQQRTKTILLFSLVGLVLICLIFSLIFSIKHYKRKNGLIRKSDYQNLLFGEGNDEKGL